jgi:hypothetical protein
MGEGRNPSKQPVLIRFENEAAPHHCLLSALFSGKQVAFGEAGVLGGQTGAISVQYVE